MIDFDDFTKENIEEQNTIIFFHNGSMRGTRLS